MKILLVRLLPLLLSILALGARAEIVRIGDTDVYLDAPPGFVRAENFSGLQQIQTSSSIVVNELAAPFGSIVGSLSPDALVLEGILVSDTERFESGGHPALLPRLKSTFT